MPRRKGAAPRALAIGEALIDIVEAQAGDRQPIELVGGSPASVALGLCRLGVAATLLTHVGRDARGERIAAELQAEGVRLEGESFSADRTTTARALIARDGTATYTFDISWDVSRPSSSDFELVHAGSLGLFLPPGADTVERILRDAARRSVVSLDPNIRPDLLTDRVAAVERFERLAGLARVVKLSDEDAAWLYPGLAVPAVAARLRGLGPEFVAVTLGAEGAYARVGGGQGADTEVRVPIQPGPLVDTISAGDSFMASLLASVVQRGLPACRDDAENVLRRAARASAIAVSVAGAHPPTLAELDALDSGDEAVLGVAE